MKLPAILLYLLASFAHAGTIVPLPPGCTVNGSATVSVTCDAPTPPPVSYCRNLASHTPGIASFVQWSGWQTVYSPTTVTPKGVKDVASFDATWNAWPGSPRGVTTWFPLPKNRYVSERFTVTGAAHGGQFGVNPTGFTAPISATLSTTCGDFSNPSQAGSTVVPGCWKNKMSAVGALVWFVGSGACSLAEGRTYYLNFVNADISTVQPGAQGFATSAATARCGATCLDPLQNQWQP